MNNKSKKSYSVSSKIEAVKRISTGESVTVIARELGVARKTLYIWSKRYSSSANRNKPQSLDSRYVSGNNHHKSVSKSLRFKLLTLVVKHPSWSLNQYADALKMGRHGIYNALRRFDLTTVDGRLAFSNLYYGPGKLETDIKVSIIRSIERGDVSIAEIAREYHISRKTIYRWIKQYQDSHDLTPCYVKGQDHHKSFASKDVDTILGMVRKYPESSIHELARLTDYSSHGIYNVLSRYNLTTADKRRAYAVPDGAVQPRRAPLVDRVKTVYEQFTPQKAPAPPPVFQLLKTFFISAGASFVTFLSLGYWIDLILTAPSLSFGIGIVFAGISLMMGTLFFLYSFKYYITLAIVLSYSQSKEDNNSSTEGGFLQRLFGYGAQPQNKLNTKAIGLESNLDHIHLSRHPYISVQIPFFNEKYVAERAIIAATNFDYDGEYEVMVCDDSTDETTEIIRNYLRKNCIHGAKAVNIRKEEGWELYSAEVKPGVTLKHLHRTSRSGFKGAALKLALTLVDERTEFISIFDADFVPYPDSLELFLKYFKAQNDGKETYENSNVAVVQGYQWHVLNKSENWITRGVRSEYSGSYVIERSGQEVYGGLKHISGSVYMIRKDVLEKVGWASSITEDYELTLKLYEAGYKVVYTPYIQAPAECVSTLKRLIRQRMRWAEGHSYNVKLMWKRLLWGRWEVSKDMDSLMQGSTVKNNETMNQSNNEPIFVPSPLTFAEKMEFMFNIPYYLQAFFFLVGTLAWLLSEAIFPAQLPFWTSLWGWSLVLTNMFALPLVNAVGLFLEESEERDYSGLASFVILSYLVVPFQAYAAMKGFLEKEEGGWFRTPKTGVITDVFKRGTFYRFIEGILPGRISNPLPEMKMEAQYLALNSANSTFDAFSIAPSSRRWIGKLAVTIFLALTTTLVSFAPYITNETVSANEFHTGTILSENGQSGNKLTDGDRIFEREIDDLKLESVAKDFLATESPRFTLRKQQSLPASWWSKAISLFKKQPHLFEQTRVILKDEEGNDISGGASLSEISDYEVSIAIDESVLSEGTYTLVVTENGQEFSQDFSWGVLAINPDKSVYREGDVATIAIGVLDDHGRMVCDANLDLSVFNAEGTEIERYTTADKTITVNASCNSRQIILKGDYEVAHRVGVEGDYSLRLVAETNNGRYEVRDTFSVRNDSLFEVRRIAATRIYPRLKYPVIAEVTAYEDYHGFITELVPNEFTISQLSPETMQTYLGYEPNLGLQESFKVSETPEGKIVEWFVNWKKGETYQLGYQYDAPDTSPEQYQTGPLTIGSFKESRIWQIASDALSYTEKANTFSASSANAWVDVDLSGSPYNVPANAVVEIVVANNAYVREVVGGVRANGSSLDRVVLLREAEGAVAADGSNGNSAVTMHAMVDSSSILEVYSQNNTTNISFTLVGYWENVSFTEAWSSFTAGADASWQDVNLSSYGVGASEVAEIIIQNANAAAAREAGIRTNGSSLSRIVDIQEAESGGVDALAMTVLADATANATIEAYAEVNANVTFYVTGYWDTAPGTYTEKFETLTNPAADVTWTDRDLSGTPYNVPASAVTDLLVTNGDTNAFNNMGARSNGSSLSRYVSLMEAEAGGRESARMSTPVDASSILEIYHEDVSDTPFSYYLMGYWEEAATAPTGVTLYNDDGGSNQIAFNNIRQNTTTPIFRASATHTGTFDRFQIELNTAANFAGTAYTETFSSTYSSATQYNLQTTGSLSLPSTNGVTYYVRARASSDAGSTWSDWSTGTWTFTYTSTSGSVDWFQTTDEQFDTGTLTNTATSGSDTVITTVSGTIMSPAVDYDNFDGAVTWGEIDWSETETNGSISMQVYYNNGSDCDTIIPDGSLSGNSTGFTSGPINIVGLNTTTYNRICLRASLTYSGGSPSLNDWQVSWSTTEPIGANATATSFQRKTFYDTTNSSHWRLYHDGSQIAVEYSQNTGSSWNSATALAYNTNDFSVWQANISGTEYVWVAVADSNDIVVRRGTLGATSVTWDGTSQVALNGTGASDTYAYPYISLDSSNYIWVGARHYDGTNYVYRAVDSAATANSTWASLTWNTSKQLSENQTNTNVYGNIVPLDNQDMYATFVSNTALQGCTWDDSDGGWEDSLGSSCTDATALVRTTEITETFNPGTSSALTSEFTPASNSLLVVMVNGGGTSSSLPTWNPTIVDSEALIWTEHAENSRTDSFWTYGSTVWTAELESGVPMALLIDHGSDTVETLNVAVFSIENYDTVDPIGGVASDNNIVDGADSITLSETPLSSSLVLAGLDAQLSTSGANNATPGSDFTELVDFGDSSVWAYLQAQERTNSTSTTVSWVDTHASGGTWFAGSAVALEVHAGSTVSRDSIDTVPTGLSKNLSTVVDPTNYDVHLAFIDDEATDQVSYKRWDRGTGTWDSSATLIANAASANDAHVTLSYDTTGSDLYAIWVDTSDNHIYYSSCDISTECNLASEWATETDWHTETAPRHLSSNYSGAGNIFALWTDGSGVPYTVEWDAIIVPEHLWIFFLLGPILPKLSKKKYRSKLKKKFKNLIARLKHITRS